jgi:uncharacterized protein (DUF2267 family)
MELMEWDDRHKAYGALRAVLHALRDRLTVEEVAELGAQLPMLVRGIYYEGWDPSGKPLKERHREQFLARIEQELKDGDDAEPAMVATSVFSVLERRVSGGEIKDVQHVLPKEIRDLWPAVQSI